MSSKRINKDGKNVDQTGYKTEGTGNFSDNYQELYRETLTSSREFRDELTKFAEAINETSDNEELGKLIRSIYESNFQWYVDHNIIVEGGFSR